MAEGNWLSMDKFMDKALFDVEFGYYSQNINSIGYRGDFSTSATQSTLLARKIVAHWQECCDSLGFILPFIEIGGGTGTLMNDISRELGFLRRMRARYHMVERSPQLRMLQKALGGGFVRTHETIHAALKSTKGRAYIFSNELPDAFPARQFVFQEGEWLELGLAILDKRIQRQAWKQELPKSSVFECWAQEGQVVEVHESYHRWYASWQDNWTSGYFVTIDYGNINEKLYYRRPQGSMRGYKAHQILDFDELLPLVGHCDITCDVNFTDLRHLAEGCMGDVVELINQHDFLAPLARPGDRADAHVIAKPGAGDHFQVLIQQRFEL